jgi:hypothetical protein
VSATGLPDLHHQARQHPQWSRSLRTHGIESTPIPEVYSRLGACFGRTKLASPVHCSFGLLLGCLQVRHDARRGDDAVDGSPSELQAGSCHICKVTGPGHSIPLLFPELRLEEWRLCRSCWCVLQRGFQRITPDEAFEPYLHGGGFRFTEAQIRSYITVGLYPDEEVQLLVGGKLRMVEAELDAAIAANDRQDWRAVLAVVRML